ncbi:MAG TPA: [protein-PII] uridylyltransferase [Pirellulales bacterium]|jgi:[protein-PII] uridylyltransferase|nr:[protein-PII] uridylyltransferase [Pirellulales bacterium]
MSGTLKLRPGVVAAREWLAAERHKLRQQHEAGSPGIQVCAHLTEMLDTVVLSLYESALEDFPDQATRYREEVALVALGGYGRGDVAPYSDVDLMILHSPVVGPIMEPLAKRLLHDLYDVGFALGQSVRTPAEACKLAAKDATIYTALVESRFLTGGEPLYEKFLRGFQRDSRRHWRGLLKAIERAREEERSQYGETVYLLEPNVKRSPGALRDIQLMRWLGFARYGEAEPNSLQMMGAILKDDQRTLRRASEFLLRTRNDLHFHAGKSRDVLDRAEQVRLAAAFSYQGTEGLLPVEQFMREYFRHTREVSQLVGRFVAQIRPWIRLAEWLSPMLGHQMEGDFIVGPRIKATRRGLAKLQADVTEVLRLADLSNLYDTRVASSTWQAVHEASPVFSDQLTPTAAARFLSLLSQPQMLGELLHQLHEVGVLEKVVPEFAHARCLLQFNEYHKFTVDEHCLRGVDEVTRFQRDRGLLGEVYRGLQQKSTLHLALLIHDLGKGYVEDHSEVGLRIAENTARRLRLPEQEAETLKFLVHKHLLMSHLAFRRDTSDDQLIVRFAVEVGSPEVLRMLYLLTAADLAAVGPGVLNQWKSEVLADLYHRTMRHLAGDSHTPSAEERRDDVLTLFRAEPDFAWFAQQVAALPSSLLFSMPAERIAEQLRQLKTLAIGDVRIATRYLADTGTVEFVIATHEDIAPGVFHKLTGGLTSQGLEILSADINTLAERLVLDLFVVRDPDYSGEPPPDRIEHIDRRLTEALTANQQPAFRRVWTSVKQQRRDGLHAPPTRVRTDNSTSESFTILDIFASDRTGLLYTIARTIFELGLSVSLAKIGTYLDQVVDVFYVTDHEGQKIDDEARLEQIRSQLLQAIEAFEREGQ